MRGPHSVQAGMDMYATCNTPTYSRGKLWWERAAFWIDHQWEVPQTPAGLNPADRRSTYEDDAEG